MIIACITYILLKYAQFILVILSLEVAGSISISIGLSLLSGDVVKNNDVDGDMLEYALLLLLSTASSLIFIVTIYNLSGTETNN